MKKVFGMKGKKKPDDSDEDSPSYTDPAALHATEMPSRNPRGISHPHYPPPRPCHGGSSPNPRRKNQDTVPAPGNKKPQHTESNRNSVPGFVSGEPKRAPPRINISKKPSDTEDDYCDPIDVQRKDDFIQEMKGSKPIKDDYCEPWDSTMKTDPANISKKQGTSDDDVNEYLDPYDTGKEGIIEKRMSRGFGAQGKILTNEQRRSALDIDTKNSGFDPSKSTTDDYDTPWEWKQKIQMQQGRMKIPKPAGPQNQRPKSNLPSSEQDKASLGKPLGKPVGHADDYDEPWERKQSYLLKTQTPTPNMKSRSPVPLPRQVHPPNNDGQLYEQPWDAMNQSNDQQPQAEGVYEMPWDATGGAAADGNRRFSQPTRPTSSSCSTNRKFSQPTVIPPGFTDDYDTPWEYKNKQQFGNIGPPKPSRLNEIANLHDINPDLPLDQQSWYHGPLKRQEAEELLRDALDCSFLVRNSESSKKDFSLSMKNNENFLHLKIVRQLDGQFILGQFSKPFMDIPKVICHYSKNILNIRGAEHKYLKHPIGAQPEYHTIEPGVEEEEDDVAL